jgi:hypothetical protein
MLQLLIDFGLTIFSSGLQILMLFVLIFRSHSQFETIVIALLLMIWIGQNDQQSKDLPEETKLAFTIFMLIIAGFQLAVFISAALCIFFAAFPDLNPHWVS